IGGFESKYLKID
ncbi:unnamed protein product, partial [Allacma fusca]